MTCYRYAGGIICGKLGPQCRDCGGVANLLCDFPVAEGKTCDRPICEDCASPVAPDADIHYCAGHRAVWQEFKESKGYGNVLLGVFPLFNNPHEPSA